VYGQSSIAAFAVAAHEIGHVMQYRWATRDSTEKNDFCRGRPSAPTPRRGSSSSGSDGLFLLAYRRRGALRRPCVFQVVTLPVEFKPPTRAEIARRGQKISYDESDGARKVLNAAAMTYVWAAVLAHQLSAAARDGESDANGILGSLFPSAPEFASTKKANSTASPSLCMFLRVLMSHFYLE
jgi:hypothetical protein